MTRVLVLYHSVYGHVERMASAEAEGARGVPGTDVVIKRVAECVGDETTRRPKGTTGREAPEATPEELAEYDAIIFGTPTRYGNMSGQMRLFLDRPQTSG